MCSVQHRHSYSLKCREDSAAGGKVWGAVPCGKMDGLQVLLVTSASLHIFPITVFWHTFFKWHSNPEPSFFLVPTWLRAALCTLLGTEEMRQLSSLNFPGESLSFNHAPSNLLKKQHSPGHSCPEIFLTFSLSSWTFVFHLYECLNSAMALPSLEVLKSFCFVLFC